MTTSCRPNTLLKGFSILAFSLSVWLLVESMQGRSWQTLFAIFIGLPCSVVAVIAAFFGRLEITDIGISRRIGNSPKLCNTLPWNAVARIVDDPAFLFFFYHRYRILPKQEPRVRSSKPEILCGNLLLSSSQEFLNEIVLRVPPNTLIDQSILEWLGLTPADIGRLYQEPQENLEFGEFGGYRKTS